MIGCEIFLRFSFSFSTTRIDAKRNSFCLENLDQKRKTKKHARNLFSFSFYITIMRVLGNVALGGGSTSTPSLALPSMPSPRRDCGSVVWSTTPTQRSKDILVGLSSRINKVLISSPLLKTPQNPQSSLYPSSSINGLVSSSSQVSPITLVE